MRCFEDNKFIVFHSSQRVQFHMLFTTSNFSEYSKHKQTTPNHCGGQTVFKGVKLTELSFTPKTSHCNIPSKASSTEQSSSFGLINMSRQSPRKNVIGKEIKSSRLRKKQL